jgi:hypothetical protein
MWARFNQEIYILKNIMLFIDIFLWTRKMRAKLGLGMLPILRKPDHLVLVNSLIGIETPQGVPPLLNPVGPILSDHYTQLDGSLSEFLAQQDKTVFVAFGTHVVLSPARLQAILFGIVSSLQAGHINGMIWAMRDGSKMRFASASPEDRVVYIGPDGTEISFSHTDLLKNQHPHMRFVDFAPQRAVLTHPSTRLFFTHAGPSSVNEGVYHGVPMLTMGMFGDQLARTLALKDAGVAESVKKETVTAEQIVDKIGCLMSDTDSQYRRNVLRLQRIAILASRRKALAADLVEEFLYDHELRFVISRHDDVRSEQDIGTIFDRGRELRPIHLETADMRMNIIRARNIELWLTGVLIVAIFIVSVRYHYHLW